jgi:hypothetical protein
MVTNQEATLVGASGGVHSCTFIQAPPAHELALRNPNLSSPARMNNLYSFDSYPARNSPMAGAAAGSCNMN